MSIDLEEVVVPVYIINLKHRIERLNHITEQFEERPEFVTTVIEACQNKVGAIGLWQSIVRVIEIAIHNEEDVIIICEDDHEFTKNYSKDYLFEHIVKGYEQGAEILSGGIGSFGYAVPLSKNMFWINPFQSTQFIILYSRIFPKILSYVFKTDDVADLVLSSLSSHKMVLFPFVSRQKDFGYSDITFLHNEEPGLVQKMFDITEKRLGKIQNAYIKYILR